MSAVVPAPRTLYVHDDLSDELAGLEPTHPARALGAALLSLLRSRPGRVVVLTLAAQLDGLVAAGDHPPFAVALAIGRAGARVAGQAHARTGWFPAIERIDLWREEDGAGGYVLAGAEPLRARLDALAGIPSLAVVDDTVFSGLTMGTVLDALPCALLARTHAFCLRAAAASLPALRRRAPVTAGFTAPGRLLEDVSFINAGGLVRRGAIRRRDGPPLAFFERPEWMAAWFPGYDREVAAVCRELAGLLDAGTAG